MSFPKMTVTHAELRDATKDGPIAVRLVGEPIAVKYPSAGKPVAVMNFQFNAKAYQLSVENDAIAEYLKGRDGHMVEWVATGAKDSANLDIKEVAMPAAQLPPKREARVQEDAPSEPEEPPIAPRIGRLRSILYGRTLKVRDYENFRLELEIELSDADDAKAAYKALIEAVDGKADAILSRLQKKTH